jgi:hypothetical protein
VFSNCARAADGRPALSLNDTAPVSPWRRPRVSVWRVGLTLICSRHTRGRRGGLVPRVANTWEPRAWATTYPRRLLQWLSREDCAKRVARRNSVRPAGSATTRQRDSIGSEASGRRCRAWQMLPRNGRCTRTAARSAFGGASSERTSGDREASLHGAGLPEDDPEHGQPANAALSVVRREASQGVQSGSV